MSVIFVGGLAGGLADNSDSNNILTSYQESQVRDNVSVQANAFGGGCRSYYVIPRVDNRRMKNLLIMVVLYTDIANKKCIYSGDDRNIADF